MIGAWNGYYSLYIFPTLVQTCITRSELDLNEMRLDYVTLQHFIYKRFLPNAN